MLLIEHEKNEFFCSLDYQIRSMDAILVDDATLVPNHPVWTHMFCVLLRCALGYYIWTRGVHHPPPYLPFLGWDDLFAVIALFFTYKWLTRPLLWKVYARTVLVYVLCLLVQRHLPPDRAAVVCGLLVVVDALLGLQSRHMVEILKSMEVGQKVS